MFNALVNKPYHIIERQQLVQRSTAPIYYRLPRSNIYMASYYTLFTIGMLSSAYGAFSLIKGKKTE
ncbi:hypothetical protein NEOLEDRAFT_1128120 [Neolentinus lepideus HHB14362 ss-1]|uniref:Uncharacterized protein n=1 Tax=Neolentinus lepideus HHB14362 ss-1 TaxID=1314782 RepID=A0A165V9Y5_9AGAM|nr:hypothetical protein NEOLEDRAFT_1128120 [Neolentinus lepideus HHB14362 ss-1]